MIAFKKWMVSSPKYITAPKGSMMILKKHVIHQEAYIQGTDIEVKRTWKTAQMFPGYNT
jgi:hypothetical protein